MNAAPLILDLADTATTDATLAGGKGAQLSQLARYGLPVPDGLVVTTVALAQAMDDELVALTNCAMEDAEALERVRSGVLAVSLPRQLTIALGDELRRRVWESVPLAVRSSTPMEDSRQASFAGIHHSVLNVIGGDAIGEAIRTVWASLWTPQAVAYRQRMEIPDVGMAIVIMPMVRAVAAGIGFSCDPATGRDDRVVINAVPGLANALVAGQVSGEAILLQVDPVSEKYAVLSRQGPPAGLSDCHCVELAELVRETAFVLDYSAPWVDIEWVWDGDHFHLVQARPVTARPWHTYPALAGQPAVWSNGNTRDVVPDVMNAFDWAYSRRLVNLLLEQSYRQAGYHLLPGAQRAALFQGRLYLNVAFIQWEAYDALGVEPSMMNRLLGGHQHDIVVPPSSISQRAARLWRMVRYLIRAPRVRRTGRQQLKDAGTACAAKCAEDLSKLTAEELAQQLDALGLHICRQDGLMFLQASSGGSLSLLLDVLDRQLPGEAHAVAAALMVGGEGSVTARQGYELQELAVTASKDPIASAWLRTGALGNWQSLPEASIFRRAFTHFIERYGHRGIYESYMRSPRWREDASYLLHQIAGMLDSDPATVRIRQEATTVSACHHLARLPWWLRPWVRTLARNASHECNDRESARNAFTAYGEIARRLLLEIGRRLVAQGDLADAAQIVHLTPQEVIAAANGTLGGAGLRHRVADRERLCVEWDAQPAPEVIIEGTAHPKTVPQTMGKSQTQSGDWCGIAIGAGCASGAARLILHPQEGKRLAAGDILVAPSTDPAWTPFFLRAGGLVMETGGYLSHGAIVAREFGIPAVANLPGILQAVADGDRLEVNGDQGTVRRIAI